MEELKLLVSMVANLPSMALWVVAFFFVYKVSIIGSVYGVIRFCVGRAYAYGVHKKINPPIEREIVLKDTFHGITINHDDTMKELLQQIQRIVGKRVSSGSKFIHGCSVSWLRDAINEKEQKDQDNEKDKGEKNV